VTDYLTCPACQGRGVVPIDQAAGIEETEGQCWAESIAADVAALDAALSGPPPGPHERKRS
jgi:hypothetical protein